MNKIISRKIRWPSIVVVLVTLLLCTHTAYASYICKPQPSERGSDGCSADVHDPASEHYKKVFRPACDNHDVCYSTPTARKGRCDADFSDEMHDICDDEPFYRQIDCRSAAVAWYGAVALGGQKAYENGQKWALDHCSKPKGPIISKNPGAHKVVFAYDGNDALCLDFRNKSRNVVVWGCSGKPIQRWSFHGDNEFFAKTYGKNQVWNDKYGPGSCLTSPNVPIYDDTWAKKKRQQYMEKLTNLYLSGKNLLQVAKCKTKDMTGVDHQKFEIKSGGLIYNPTTNLCLNIAGSYKTEGTNVILWPCEKTENEVWKIHVD